MALTPFPIATPSETFVDETFADWASKGWTLVATEGDDQPASYWNDGVDDAYAGLSGSELFQWFPDEAPFERVAYITKTYTGFASGQTIVITIGYRWTLGVGFEVGSSRRFGVEINGEYTRPTGPIFFGDGSGTLRVIATADASGEVVINAGLLNVFPSFNIDAAFTTITITSPPADLNDIIQDTAVLYVSGYPLTITREGASFDEQAEWDDYDFPGRTVPVAGGDELVGSRPVIRASVMMVGEYQILAYAPGGAWADHATITGARTYTPTAFRAALAAGVYLANVIAVWKRLRGDFIAVEFPLALCRRYGIHGADRDEGQIAVEIEARQDLSGGVTPKTTRLYYIHTFPAGTEF